LTMEEEWETNVEWETWKLQYGKTYGKGGKDSNLPDGTGSYGPEETFRMKIWMDNQAKIEEHNRNADRGFHSFQQKLNGWADFPHDEFVATVNGLELRPPKLLGAKPMGAKFLHEQMQHIELPENVDWREYGAVTPVKNQGLCRSCWSFATTGALEAMHHQATGELVNLSEQNLIDCSNKYGNNGCSGGLMDNAFQYIKDNGGIDTERSYPYEARNGKCRYNAANIGSNSIGFVDVEAGNEEALKIAVATQGPCGIGIDASHPSLQFYHKGVYKEQNCSPFNLDHAVLVVGYGVEETGEAYWLVKNSWGTNWGLQGYVKIARNEDNMCGVATLASYPLVPMDDSR